MLQTNHIHLAVTLPDRVTAMLAALKASPATAKALAKFVLATDGQTLEAEDVANSETVACTYADFPDHFGFFLPLAGITTVKQVRESSFDIRDTSRLNRLCVELLKDNPGWERRRFDRSGTQGQGSALDPLKARLENPLCINIRGFQRRAFGGSGQSPALWQRERMTLRDGPRGRGDGSAQPGAGVACTTGSSTALRPPAPRSTVMVAGR